MNPDPEALAKGRRKYSLVPLMAAREETAWRERLYSAPTIDPVDE